MYGYVVLSLVLAVVATDVVVVDTPPNPLWVLVGSVAVLAAVLLAGLAISGFILLCRHRLETREQQFLRMVGVLGRLYRALVVCANALILFGCGWAELARAYGPVGGWDVGVLALNVVPICLLLLVAWTALYVADRRLRALMFQRAGAPLVGRHWTLPRYLEFMFRQYLLVILVPLVGLLTLHDAAYRLVAARGMPMVALLVDVLGVVTAVMLAGAWVRVCWRTEPLPEGPLRSRLLALAERAGIRVANVLIWRTNLSIANGCMVGLVGPFRYIMITDALLLSLSGDEVEAVFAHETAHVKYRHAWLLMVMTLGAIGLSMVAGSVALDLTGSFTAGSATMVAGIVLYLATVFGFVSRRCEQECDLYAVRATRCPADCSPPDPGARTLWETPEAASASRGPVQPAPSAGEPQSSPVTDPPAGPVRGQNATGPACPVVEAAGTCDHCMGRGGCAPIGSAESGAVAPVGDPPAGPERVAAAPEAAGRPRSSICRHRIQTFDTALRRIARLNGTAERRRGLRHFSIARRRSVLKRLLDDPLLAARMEQRIGRMKAVVLVVSLIAVLAAGLVLIATNQSEPNEPEDPTGPENIVPRYDTLIARLVDGDEVDVVALGPPQFHRDADVAADPSQDRVPWLRLRASARNDDVAVANPGGHAVAVHAEGKRACLDGTQARHVEKLRHAVRRGFG